MSDNAIKENNHITVLKNQKTITQSMAFDPYWIEHWHEQMESTPDMKWSEWHTQVYDRDYKR